MTGTILKQLLATPQADSTAMSAANSGFTSWQPPGLGAAGVHLTAARMGEPAGYRFTQSSSGTTFGYLDLDSTVTKLAFRMPFRYAATPTASAAILRGYSSNAHSPTLWTIQLTTANRMQFFEQGTGGLNITSGSGTPLVVNTQYVAMGLIDSTADTVTVNVYPLGSTTPLFSITGALAADTAAAVHGSIRLGIGTASSLTQLDTNSAFAIGSDDFLERHDVVSNTAPNAGEDQTVDSFTKVFLDAVDAESSVTWTQTAGTSVGALTNEGGNLRSFIAPANKTQQTYTFTATDTGSLTDSVTITVLPHNEWRVVTGGLVPMQIKAVI